MKPILINGEWQIGDYVGSFHATNPTTTQAFTTEYPISGRGDLELALSAGVVASRALAQSSPEQRANFLEGYADLIEAKLHAYDPEALLRSYDALLGFAGAKTVDPSEILLNAPPTLVAPGVKGRWIYSREVAERILAYRLAIESLEDQAHCSALPRPARFHAGRAEQCAD